MRGTNYLLAALLVLALGYATCIGHTLLGAYIDIHLSPALSLSGFGFLLLPGLGSSLVTGFLLAAITRLIIPRFAFITPLLATVPWIAFHVWAWTIYGTTKTWWVIFSDIASLVIATALFAILFRRFRPSQPPNSSFKADGSAAA